MICVNGSAENGDSDVSGESRVRVMHIQQEAAPVDGSLYARVNHSRHESHTASTSHASVANGGPGVLPNGPLNVSHDSGISSTSGTRKGKPRFVPTYFPAFLLFI